MNWTESITLFITYWTISANTQSVIWH